MSSGFEEIGYVALFLYSFGGGFVGLATAGAMAGLGKLNLLLSILLAGTANFLGSTLIFFFAKSSKSEALSFLRKHRRKLALMHILMKKRGSSVIFATKFIYGLKTIAPLTAGITKYNPRKFIFLNFFASFVWAIAVGLAAYGSGELLVKVLGVFEDYKLAGFALLAVIVAALYLLLNKFASSKQKTESESL